MSSLKSQIESLLFIANRPFSTAKIASQLKVKADEALVALTELYQDYDQRQSGVRLLKNKDEWQLGTAPDNASLVSQFLQEELSGELTRPQLETLTVIAYRGPITKAELEQIRGVNCGLILRNLLIRGLIEARDSQDGKIIRYHVTMDFLRFLGLTSVEYLPDYERLHSHEVMEAILKQGEN